MSTTELVVQKVIAIVGGISAGVVVHFLSRAFGIEYTLPGSLWAAAFASAMLCCARFNLK